MGYGIGRNPWRGLKGQRYEWMLANMPEEAERIRQSGEMDAYLDKVVSRYQERAGELYPRLRESLGATQELAETDYGRWLGLDGQALRVARETAFHEVIEAG